MSIQDVFHDDNYRTLAEDVLRRAANDAYVDIASVGFAKEGYRDNYSWLCFVVDPLSEDHIAPMTGSSAADHLALTNPQRFSENAGARLATTIFSLELAHEATISVRGQDALPTLFSPWVANLAVAKALFNYTQI